MPTHKMIPVRHITRKTISVLLLFLFGLLFADSTGRGLNWERGDDLILYYFPFNIYTLTPLSVMSLVVGEEKNTDARIQKYSIGEDALNILTQIIEMLNEYTPEKTMKNIALLTGEAEEIDILPAYINVRIAIIYKKYDNVVFTIGIGQGGKYFSYNEAVFLFNKELLQKFYQLMQQCGIHNVITDFSENFDIGGESKQKR